MAIDQAAPLGEAPSAGAFYNRNMMGSGSREGGPGPIRGSNMSESSNAGFSSLSGSCDFANPVSTWSNKFSILNLIMFIPYLRYIISGSSLNFFNLIVF